MSAPDPAECCPRFDPEPWDEKVVTWENKRFLQDRVRSFLHIPLNFGAVMIRSMKSIEAANAAPEEMIVLADDNSLWGADVYVAVSKDMPGKKMTTLSGTFLTKVFEGPYKDMRKWMEEMKSYVKSKEETVQKMYMYYTTCPKCAKKYGKNFVVILSRV